MLHTSQSKPDTMNEFMKDTFGSIAPISLRSLNHKDGSCHIYSDQNIHVIKTNITSKKTLFNASSIAMTIGNETGTTDLNEIEKLIYKSSGENWGNVSGPYLIREGVYQCYVTYSPGSINKFVIEKGTPKECLKEAHLFLTYFYSQKITDVNGKDSVVNAREAQVFVLKVLRRLNQDDLENPINSIQSSRAETESESGISLPMPRLKRTKLI